MDIRDYLQPNTPVAEAFMNAVHALSDGDTLSLGGGHFDVFSDGAYQKYYCISNNDKGEKRIAFPLIGKKNITIDGEGAELLFHGSVIPFVIDGCENITVKNCSIDYVHPEYAQAEIIDADREHVVLQFSKEFPCRVENNKMIFQGPDGEVVREQALCMEFDRATRAPSAFLRPYFFYSGAPKDHGFLRKMYHDVTLCEMGEGRIELQGDVGFTHTIGNFWVCTFGSRNCPGIFLNASSNIHLENIDLYHAPAMGVIAQLSENITLDHVNAVIREGSERMVSVKADATHFVNCRGRIEITNSKYVNMMDDACNIHGIYLAHAVREDERTFSGGFGHHQQEGINLFRAGDCVALIDRETQEICATLTVRTSVLETEKRLVVTTEEDIPDLPPDCVAENLSTVPDVHLCGVESGNNRPRGFLLSSSGHTLVENCTFYNMYAGIGAGMDMANWYESGAIRDLTVKNCDFCNSAYAGGPAISLAPAVKNKEQAGAVFGRICIESNTFRMAEERFLKVENAKEVIFKDNTFTKDPTLPSHPEPSGAISLIRCEESDIQPVLYRSIF